MGKGSARKLRKHTPDVTQPVSDRSGPGPQSPGALHPPQSVLLPAGPCGPDRYRYQRGWGGQVEGLEQKVGGGGKRDKKMPFR